MKKTTFTATKYIYNELFDIAIIEMPTFCQGHPCIDYYLEFPNYALINLNGLNESDPDLIKTLINNGYFDSILKDALDYEDFELLIQIREE